MPNPTFRSVSIDAETTSGTSVSVAMPTGHAAGDLLIISAHGQGSYTVNTPASWTQIDQKNTYNFDKQSALFYRVATGSGMPNVTVSISATGSLSACCFSFKDVDAAPIDASTTFSAV